MNKILLIATISCSLFLGGSLTAAEPSSTVKGKIDTGKHHSAQESAVLQKHIKREAGLIQAASPEIQKAVQGTIDAVSMMMNGRMDDANQSLAAVVEIYKLSIKADPDVGLVSIENKLAVNELVASEGEIKGQIRLIRDLLRNNNIQEAREMIQPLRDEIDITTIYLPVKIFAKASEKAYKALQEKDSQTAINTIRIALNTLVTVKLVMPIPLILSEDLLMQASALDKSKKEEVVTLLDQAQSQLNIAMLLGYTDKHSQAHATLNTQIDAIKEEIKGKNEVEKLYEEAKATFKKLEEKVNANKQKINEAISGKSEK